MADDDDVKDTLICYIPNTKFTLLVDGTNVAGLVVSMVFGCYIYLQIYQEDFICRLDQ